MHVRLSHYLLVLRGVLPGELLLQQAHRHLLDLCPACRKEWDGRPPFESASEIDLAANTDALVALRPPPERHFSLSHYDETLRRQSRLRAIARRAREDLSRLRRKPLETWPDVVRNATKRYRSRAFLLLLVEESRARVRNAPHEAAALVALVPIALDRSPERAALPWARVLRMRAAAHHANALRVAGDLPAADRELAALRRTMQSHPLHSRDTEAEVSSLEASLRIGQRRFGEANRLLAAAAELASPQLASRIFVKHAHTLLVTSVRRSGRSSATSRPAPRSKPPPSPSCTWRPSPAASTASATWAGRARRAGCWPPSEKHSPPAATGTSRPSAASTRRGSTSGSGASTAL